MPDGRRLAGLRPEEALRRPLGAGALVGVALGLALAALVLLRGADEGSAHRATAPQAPPGQTLDAAHLPPSLTVPGETVELRYDIYCPPPAGAATDACDAAGSVFVRAGTTGAFTPLPLSLDAEAAEGRYVARVPESVAASPRGFTYYAVLRDRATGASMTVPGGGPAAPARSLPLHHAVEVDLGSHEFGRTRPADERVFGAIWGDGARAVGLEGGPEAQPIGPSSFAVATDGGVTVLDQAHRRVLRVPARGGGMKALPLAVNGTLADLALADDGSLWVLETAGPGGPRLRGFRPDGEAQSSIPLAERTAAQVRMASGSPVVKQYPSEQWLPAVEPGTGTPLSRAAQRERGDSVQPSRDGAAVVVLAAPAELRVALTGPSGVRKAWRLRSGTALAEVQLAEPLGGGVLLVVRVYDERRDEFVVLRLTGAGVARRFSVDSADWAETAALARFRVRGASLYQLGSTPAGAHVDRYDLEVTS